MKRNLISHLVGLALALSSAPALAQPITSSGFLAQSPGTAGNPTVLVRGGGGGGHGFSGGFGGGHAFGGGHGFHGGHFHGGHFYGGYLTPYYYDDSECWWSSRHHRRVCS